MSDANNQNENGQANPPQDANLAVKPKSRSLNPFGLGIYHLVISVLLILFIYMLWPNATPVDGKLVFEQSWEFFGYNIPINDEYPIVGFQPIIMQYLMVPVDDVSLVGALQDIANLDAQQEALSQG